MLKIGEFSKLSMLTVKALRFYEKEQLLVPVHVDEWTGYRYYETSQLETAATIKALRQLDFSVDDIRAYLQGHSITDILFAKEAELRQKRSDISRQLSIIKYLLEDTEMKYQAVIKEIQRNILARYSQAVVKAGVENERINFRRLPATKAICIYHKGAYDLLGDAYAYIMRYAEENDYKVSGLARECYIDGVWNKDNVDDWLTELQLPIE